MFKAPFKPMLAKDAPAKDSPLPTGRGFVMEPKLDGWRWMVRVGDDSIQSWSGRNGIERTGKAPEIERELSWLPPDTVLDGELVIEGGGQNGVAGSSAVSSALAHHGPLLFVVFDVLRLGGVDLIRKPWSERRTFLDKMAENFDGVHVRASNPSRVDPALHEQWLAQGLEGSIVKRVEASYQPGRRSDAFIKFKPQTCDEAVVVGFVAGKGGIVGQVGAFEVRLLANGAVTTVGVPPALRDEVTRHGADDWLGKVIEFAHHGLREDSGKPRHPVFRCRRDDR